MTEAEWLACEDPATMVEMLRDRGEDRKWRIFCLECCVRAFEVIPCPDLAPLVTARLELLDEGYSSLHCNWMQERDAIERAGTSDLPPVVHLANAVARTVSSHYMEVGAGRRVVSSIQSALSGGASQRQREDQLRHQADLLRELFGSTFFPLAAERGWRTSTVLALAEGIYADRAFERLPILADALQDAGCENADVLDHCRGDGPHVRGCWVVDLVLGKS